MGKTYAEVLEEIRDSLNDLAGVDGSISEYIDALKEIKGDVEASIEASERDLELEAGAVDDTV
jgi:hypothetical protein